MLQNDIITLIWVIISTLGVIFYDIKHRNDSNIKKNSIDAVYTNGTKLKNQLEDTFKQKVHVNINFKRLQPYGFNIGPIGLKKTNIAITNSKLNEGYEALRSITDNSNNLSSTTLKEKFAKSIYKQSHGLVEIFFTETPSSNMLKNNEMLSDIENSNSLPNRLFTLSFGTIFIFLGLFTISSLSQQVYFSSEKQLETQQQISSLFEKGEENLIISNFSNESETYESPVLIDEPLNVSSSGISDIFNSIFNDDLAQNIPEIFGYLEIPVIFLDQYVVEGTSKQNLTYGPGYYIETSFPGNGGNVGIAGHRTTYGAPFLDLDKLSTGDEVFLTVGNFRFKYVIDEIVIIEPNQGEHYLYHRGDERITLTTCHPKSSDKLRLVVTGSLVNKEQVN